MRWILALMYLGSAVLPIWGIVRLYKGAKSDASEMNTAVPVNTGPTASISEHNIGLPILVRGVRERPGQALTDLWYIGVGVALGAAAGVWSLWLPAL